MQKHANFTTIQGQKSVPTVLELVQTDNGRVAVMAYKANKNSSWVCLGIFKNGEFVLNAIDSDLAEALNLQRGPCGGIQTRTPPNFSD
ncbi:hypothetical protein LCGC14_2450560 [marine sediment metagenome]|uniref:Uncharacterized protein n=1 Tax=marine sediment metagenome TaxID=412755 RepID=A0A0F9C3X0_9ZZZZ